MNNRLHVLLWCLASGLLALACFEYWTHKNLPPHKKLEKLWREDIEQLEKSGKLPSAWFDTGKIEMIGGTPETRQILQSISTPLKVKKNGQFGLELLIIVWEDDHSRGTVFQYNLTNLKTGNTIWEMARTLMLSDPAKP